MKASLNDALDDVLQDLFCIREVRIFVVTGNALCFKCQRKSMNCLYNQPGDSFMAYLDQSFDTRFSLQLSPTSFLLRLGRREIFVCRDYRQRAYYVNPVGLLHRHTGRASGNFVLQEMADYFIQGKLVSAEDSRLMLRNMHA
jgi:hypothetical protein